MTFAPHSSIVRSLALAGLAFLLSACIDSGSGGGGTTPTAQTGVSISGTVSGTRIVAVNSSDQIVAEDDTAGRTPNAQGRFAWSLGDLPVGNNIRLFFITGGNVYPMYFGNPSSNVFAINGLGAIGLGHVMTAGPQATPEFPPTGVTPGPPNTTVPSSVTPILTISSPANNETVPNGPVTITFATQNFTIGTVNQPHLHVYLDSDTVPYHFYSGAPGQVLYQGAAAANAQWQSNTQINFPALAAGTHQVQLVLANTAHADLTAEATKTIVFSVGAPSGNSPTVTITAPTQNAIVPVGPVTVSFTTQFFTIGTPGQNHLHFYLDADTTPYMLYNGAGINVDNGVLYNGVHTHSVHWKSATSFDILGLPSTAHTVRFVLADQNHNELENTEATKTLNFTVSQPPTADLQLQSALPGLNFPVGMSLAPDGRVFFNERLTGKIRIINQQWQLVATPFCQLSVAVIGEQGLLGLALDPNFAQNHFVYVYYTVAGATMNRVARYTESSGLCSTQETVILDNLPVNSFHNGGIIQFGPDGKLYVIIGDAGDMANSQILTSLAGKILRVNPDGSAPSDNPFFNNANANAKKVFSFGHRNSYGFTFHPHTKHLWETENGPGDSDEINRVIAGGNYAWDANQRRGILNDPCCVDPIAVYFPLPCTTCTIAPTGIIAIPEDSTVYPVAYRNNLLFVNYNFGQIRRLVLAGANLAQLGTQSIAYNGAQGGLLSLMLGTDGYVYVSNASGIFKVVPPLQ